MAGAAAGELASAERDTLRAAADLILAHCRRKPLTANVFDGVDSVDGADVCDITDPVDPRLDDFRDLNSIDRRPDLPSGKGLVIAEGVLVVQRMLASRFAPLAFLGTDRRLAELKADLAGSAAPYYRVSAEVMARVVGFHLNRGVLAAARRAPELSVAQVVDGARTVAVLEGVNDHENLGAIFRNPHSGQFRPHCRRARLRLVTDESTPWATGLTVAGFVAAVTAVAVVVLSLGWSECIRCWQSG